MQHFYYSFVLTLFHSLWQSLFLLGGYYVLIFNYKNAAPLFKRNLLYSLLGTQLFLSISSFLIIHFSPGLISLQQFMPTVEFLNSYSQWPMLLFVGYLLFFIFKTGKLFYSYNKLRLLKKENFLKVSAELKIFTQQKAYLLGIKRPVTIAFHKYITTPLTYGFLKPVILLPFSLCNNISSTDAETLVLHELTHIKNKDYLLNLFLPWIENIFFFNPFIQIIIKDIRLEREKSCDWQVLQFNYAPIPYAEILLQTARNPLAKQNAFLAAVNNGSELLKRIQFFSNAKNLSYTNSPKKWMVMPLFLVICIMSLLMLTNKKNKLSLSSNPINQQELTTTSLEKNNYLALPKLSSSIGNKSSLPVRFSPTETLPLKTSEQLPIPDLSITDANPTLVVDSLSLTIQPYNVIPVNYAEVDSLITREVTVTEESSGGEKVTKTYLVRLVKGEWQASPLWMIKEIPALKDSGHTLQKDSLAPLQIKLIKDSVQ